MRILLVNPPLTPVLEVMPPLGLCTLAAYLADRHDVQILDLDLETKLESGLQPGSYLAIFRRRLLDFEPDVVGLTSMYSNSLQAEEIIGEAKMRLPSVITVAGGPHFGALAAQSLRRISCLDYVVQGEGELALLLLLESLNERAPLVHIPGVISRTDHPPDPQKFANHRQLPRSKAKPASPQLLDLSESPSPWSSLRYSVQFDRYAATTPKDSRRRAIYIEAGRGCPFLCTFCATAPFWHRKYRVKTPSQIIAEMQFLHEELGYDTFMLVHDLLTANRVFVEALSDALFDARLPVE